MILPDGIQAAADREKQFHPNYTAWQRRADTLKATVAEANRLREDLSKLEIEYASMKGALVKRPF
jgi:hypothetical protein